MKGPLIASDCAVGQLGNTLLQSAHALAFCREHGLYYLNFPLGPHAAHFTSTRYSVLCSSPTFPWFPLSSEARNRLLGLARKVHAALGSPGRVRILEIDWAEEVRMDDEAFFQKIRHDWLVALRGWRFRAPLWVEKHGEALRRYFQPVRSIRDHVQKTLRACRAEADVVIGVHVRQGDYARWKDGCFFYTAAEYEELMRHVMTLFPGQRVHFLIASDALPETLRRSSLPLTVSSGSAVEDLYTLAACDYLIGPPSSFSLWASFYGQTPLVHVETAQARPLRTDFAPTRNLAWKYDV